MIGKKLTGRILWQYCHAFLLTQSRNQGFLLEHFVLLVVVEVEEKVLLFSPSITVLTTESFTFLNLVHYKILIN